MRLFFGVPLSDNVKNEIRRAIENFPVTNPPWKWIPGDNLHITLKFLGEVDERLLVDLVELGNLVAGSIDSFTIDYSRFGAFPSLSRPRVIFYSVAEGASALSELARQIEKETARIGFPPEKRAFRAHVTLARIKRPISSMVREKLRQVPPLPEGTSQRVDHFILYRSHLSRTGAVYEELNRFNLKLDGDC